MKKLNIEEHIGKQFGYLTVVGSAGTANGRSLAIIECVCGRVRNMIFTLIKNGTNTSCGCAPDFVKKSRASHITHGLSSTYHCRIWNHMKARCFDPNDERYVYYGARGITVCSRWKDSLENFIKDIGERPSKMHSLERIDNNGNYEPLNCKWATKKEQANNRRKRGTVLS